MAIVLNSHVVTLYAYKDKLREYALVHIEKKIETEKFFFAPIETEKLRYNPNVIA